MAGSRGRTRRRQTTHPLSPLEVAPISLDESFVDLPCTETFLIKPAIEMADKSELDSAAGTGIAVGCQPAGK